jgi:outer membrane immunogenic protein
MLRFLPVSVLLAGLLSLSVSAMAADVAAPVYKARPAVPDTTWSGLYVGAHVGAAWAANAGASAVTLTTAPTITDPVYFGRKSDFTGTGGFHAGYNWQFASRWVAGAEVDLSRASARNQFDSGRLTSLGAPLAVTNFATLSTKLNWLASARARWGYAWDNMMLYATGGVAWAKIDYDAVRNYAAIPPNNFASFNDTVSGWVIGGGAEYRVSTNFTLRAEYLYYSFDSSQSVTTTCGPSGCGATPPVITYSWDDTSVHIARVGGSFRF